jgi:hypothetical protein
MDFDIGVLLHKILAVASCTLHCPDSARARNNTVSFLPRIRSEESPRSSYDCRVMNIASKATNTVPIVTARLNIFMISAWQL